MRVLIAALDGATRARLTAGLTAEGHDVEAVDGGAGLTARLAHALARALPHEVSHALLLGTARTGVAPTTRLGAVRGMAAAMPVIVVGALPEREVAAALDAGADDVVPLRVGCRELAERVDAVWRRARVVAGPDVAGPPPRAARTRRIARGLVLDDGRHAVLRGGAATRLTAREYAVLAYLAERPGAVVERGELVRAVWPAHAPVDVRTVDRHLATLRRKLGDHARRPTYLRTVRGVGYRLAGADVP